MTLMRARSLLYPVALVLVALLATLGLPAAHAIAQGDDGPDSQRTDELRGRAQALFRHIESRTRIDDIWNSVLALEAIQDEADDVVAEQRGQGLTSESLGVRLAAAKLALGAEDADGAFAACESILRSSDDRAALAAAAAIAGEAVFDVEDYEVAIEALFEVFSAREDAISGVVRVAFARQRLQLAETDDDEAASLALMRAVLVDVTDSGARAEAAIALAEYGAITIKSDQDTAPDDPNVLTANVLRALARGVGNRSRLAQALLDSAELELDLELAASGGDSQDSPPFYRALATVVHDNAAVLVKQRRNRNTGELEDVAPDEQLSAESLIDSAGRGMVSGLDDFSYIMTGQDVADMQEEMNGAYGGIGAYVLMYPGDDYLTITQPIYSGPAYRAGLRSGDKIAGGNGKDFKGWTQEEVIGELKGPAGTPVTVTIIRAGWDEPRTFSLTREMILVNTAKHAMLPGDIGYVRLTRFGNKSDDDMRAALEALKANGMKSLVLDLRGNGGGALGSVVAIANMFLPPDKLISYTQGIAGVWKDRTSYITGEDGVYKEFLEGSQTERLLMPGRRGSGNLIPGIPIVCLIDGNSASGSEMLSGCLQDHDRATILGEGSFGKGVGQYFFELRSTFVAGEPEEGDPDPAYGGYRRYVRVTTFAYFLPEGRSINAVGVQPNIEMGQTATFRGEHYTADVVGWESWQRAELNRLFADDPVEKYLDEHFEGNQDALNALADFDAFSTDGYPGFDAWFESLETTLSRDDCRRLLRAGIVRLRDDGLRRRVADVRGKEFSHNLQDDTVLQRAVATLATGMNLDLSEHPQYAHFADRWR